MIKKLINKYNIASSPLKAAIWFTICNFILKGISFISGPIFTRVLPTYEYGKYSVFLSFEQIILILSTWEIQIGAYQKGIFKFKDNVKEYTSATQLLTNFLTICFFTIVFVFNNWFLKITRFNVSLEIILFVYLLFRPAYDCWLTRKRTDYDYKAAVTVTLLYSIINVVVPLLALYLVDRTANIKLGVTLIGSTLICMVFYFPYSNYIRLFKIRDRLKQYFSFNLSFGAPLVIHSLSFLVLSQADRIMISNMIGDSQAAFYSVAYSIASVITIIQNSINQSMVPWQYQMLEKQQFSQIRNVIHKLLLLFSIAIILFLMIIPEAMEILFTPDYYEAIWCIPPLSTSIYFMFVYSVFVNCESYYENTRYIMYVSVICGALNIILNYFAIQQFGYISCAYTSLISYVLFALGHYAFMRIIMQKEGIKENIVNPPLVVAISAFLVLASIGVTLLYNHTIVRYSIILFILLLIFILRKKIMPLYYLFKNK